MKVYRLKFETLNIKNGVEEWETVDLIRTDMNTISKYIVDADENPEKYRNVEFYIGDLEKVDNIDIQTIEKLFL